MALLVFNRNDRAGTLRLVRDLEEMCTEALVIDSSSPSERAALTDELAATTAVVRPALPLGCTEPLRAYAHHHLTSDWVFSVDTDESVDPPLKARLRSIPAAPGAYRVPRFDVALGQTSHHLRLYRRDRIRFAGWIHETPTVPGSVEDLHPEERLVHHALYDRYASSGDRRQAYLTLETFEHPFTGRSLRAEFPGRVASVIAGASAEALPEWRASLFVRWWSLSRWTPGSSALDRRPYRRYFADYLKARRAAFYGRPGAERASAVRIAKEMWATGGPTAYLGLDDDARVDRLTAGVPWDRSPGEIFERLVTYRHQHGEPMKEWLDV